MLIRLERVPVYERHLLFCTDLDERHTPDEVVEAPLPFLNAPSGVAKPGTPIPPQSVLTSLPPKRWLN